MKILKQIWTLMASMVLITACTQDIPTVSLGIDDIYYLERMKSYKLTPAFTGQEYRWTMKTASGKDSLVSTESTYIFLQKDEGTYDMTFEIIDPVTPYKHDFRFIVIHEEIEYSPYIAHIYEYRPAPGQFINTMPEYKAGDTEADMCKKVEESISGTNNIMISLGAYGGYVTFGFDHTVMNVKGEKDFMVLGNAFYSDIGSYKEKKGGSCEPGIVMVAFDKNQNGKPDKDEWYELAGSEYGKDTETRNYEITYYRPQPANGDVRWTDNQGGEGFVYRNSYHQQDSYYPNWIEEDEITFRGTRLKDNAINEGGTWVGYCYPWGYADNHPNRSEFSQFKIDWAVDQNGNHVELDKIDFVKIYTAVNQNVGWMGEISTEVMTVEDLHFEN